MPVIFTRPSGAVQSKDNVLGQPSDGSYADGLLDLTPTTLVADGVDEINEVLADLAPAMPGTLDGTDLVPNRSFHTGKLPSGLNSSWYQDGKSAGDTISVILEYDNIEFSSSDPSNRFSHGGEGFLVAYADFNGSGLSEVARLDVEANFDSSVVGPAVQDLTTWDNAGNGDLCTDGVVTFSGGQLQVTHCGWHNNFNKWQRMNAKIILSGMSEGYTAIRLGQILDSQTNTSTISKLWYDNDGNALSFSLAPDLSENTLSSNKWISGVRYYDIGDIFNVSYVGQHVYKKCYHISHVSKYLFDGAINEVVVNPSSVPLYSDNLSVNETIAIDKSNYYTIDARLVATLYHPWKTSLSVASPSHTILICTYGNVSTLKEEYFLDENYRLPNGSYDTIPGSLAGNWDSSTTLASGQALVFNRRVQYPNHDLSSTWPTGNPDYSSFTGDQLYLRGFYDSNPHNNVILTLGGLDLNDLEELGSGNVNILIKLPTQTGWLDAGKYFNYSDFTGIDGDGCLVSKSGHDLTITFGTFSTANSGGMIIVKIVFKNTLSYIDEMSVDW